MIFTSLFAMFAMFAMASAKEKAADVPNVTIDQVKFGPVVNEVPFDPKELVGKVVVIEGWGVSCPPCIASLPEMQRLWKSGQKKGLVVVGMEWQNSSQEAIEKVLKSARVTYPVVKDGELGYPVSGIPHVAIFGTDGKLVWKGNPHDDDFKREVRAAMRAK